LHWWKLFVQNYAVVSIEKGENKIRHEREEVLK
jgi:hypothetical protein